MTDKYDVNEIDKEEEQDRVEWYYNFISLEQRDSVIKFMMATAKRHRVGITTVEKRRGLFKGRMHAVFFGPKSLIADLRDQLNTLQLLFKK